jgi:hypothetical protein
MSQSIDINTLAATVMMPVGRWNQLLEMLGTHPWKDANPFIVEIHRQIEIAVQAAVQGGAAP